MEKNIRRAIVGACLLLLALTLVIVIVMLSRAFAVAKVLFMIFAVIACVTVGAILGFDIGIWQEKFKKKGAAATILPAAAWLAAFSAFILIGKYIANHKWDIGVALLGGVAMVLVMTYFEDQFDGGEKKADAAKPELGETQGKQEPQTRETPEENPEPSIEKPDEPSENGEKPEKTDGGKTL